MTVTPSEYCSYFRPGDQISIGVHLADKTFAEDSARVLSMKNAQICLELSGKGFPPHLPIAPGTRTVISKREGRTLFLCNGNLQLKTATRVLRLGLVDRILIFEQREYARADVNIRVAYYLPASQELGRIIHEWGERKNCRGSCIESASLPVDSDIMDLSRQAGDSRVNLSGSGLRFKIRDCLSYGTLLHLNISMPGEPQDHIHAVGSIVRTRELLPELAHDEYYSTSMAFRVIDSHDRQKLMAYVLNQQRLAIL